jgi:uncharacterized protein (TIGR02284 family)
MHPDSTNLDDKTVGRLNDLIRINIDSHKGFSEAAAVVDDPQIKTRFLQFARERLSNAEELKKYVAWNNEEPETSGSALGAAHRWWLNLRSKLTSGDDTHIVLTEAERGEDSIKHEYEEVMREAAGSPVGDVIRRQYANVKSGHDEVRTLRDSTRHGRSMP